jgi:formylglycine-generating enzyme required for sulfatase activity
MRARGTDRMKRSAAVSTLALAVSAAAAGVCVSADLLKPKSGGEMVLIHGGEFVMGSAGGRPDETPHAVTVGAFYLDRYPVTQETYEKVAGTNPSKRKNARNPVEQTQWTDAARFCNACSVLEGMTPCYNPKTWECDFTADGYRLPTEAEWEYACRAGSKGRYCFGDGASELARYAWFKENSGGAPNPVSLKEPNGFGLYDMHGNVWEWCNDYYRDDYYKKSPERDPRGPTKGKTRVLRGGAWDSTAEKCTAAYRHKEFPTVTDACFGYDSYGFRRARNVGTTSAKKKAPGSPVPGAGVASGIGGACVAPTVPMGGKADLTPAAAASLPMLASPVTAPETPAGPGAALLRGTIVFVSDVGGALDIWKMRASGANPVNLTGDPHPDADPRFSPDGKEIMYTSLRSGFPEVRAMNRDGSGSRRVAAGSQATWSPDGKRILFIRDNQTLVRELATGKERLVTPGAWERCGVPAWSPDGTRFAVASRHTGSIGIFILDFVGAKNRALETPEPACTPIWSRDGKRILCQTVKGHIGQIGADGKDWEQLTFGADVQHYPGYSPDGKTLLFCRAPTTQGPWQVCAMGLDGADRAIIKITSKGSNFLPDWDPGEE